MCYPSIYNVLLSPSLSSQSRVKVPRAGSDVDNGLGPSVFSSEGHHSPKNFEIRLKVHTIQKLELMMHTNTQESTTGLSKSLLSISMRVSSAGAHTHPGADAPMGAGTGGSRPSLASHSHLGVPWGGCDTETGLEPRYR